MQVSFNQNLIMLKGVKTNNITEWNLLKCLLYPFSEVGT